MKVKLIKDGKWHNVLEYSSQSVNGIDTFIVILEDGTSHVKTEWNDEEKCDGFPTKFKNLKDNQ